MRGTIFKTSIFIALAFIVGSCSEDGFNEFVDAEMSPKSPFLVFTDTKIGSGDNVVDVTAPWFIGAFQITNNHPDYTLIIPSLALEYSGFIDGKNETIKTSLTADDICSVIDEPTRTLYAVITPATTFTGDADCDGGTSPERIYFGGLPLKDKKSALTYQVKVTFEGYFVDSANTVKGRVKLIRYYMAI